MQKRIGIGRVEEAYPTPRRESGRWDEERRGGYRERERDELSPSGLPTSRRLEFGSAADRERDERAMVSTSRPRYREREPLRREIIEEPPKSRPTWASSAFDSSTPRASKSRGLLGYQPTISRGRTETDRAMPTPLRDLTRMERAEVSPSVQAREGKVSGGAIRGGSSSW